MPLISVVIPLYNKGPHVQGTLNSVLSQTMEDFEIIVIDGGSDDEGPTIVKEMINEDNRICLIKQKGKGVSDARNQGIVESKSELIAFLDADDEWYPNHLEVLLRLNKKYPEAGAYATAYIKYTLQKNMVITKYSEIQPPPFEGLIDNYFKAATLGESPVWTSAVCIPKKIFTDLGKFSVNDEWGEDADMWGRIALKYPIAFSWEGKAIYHMDSVNRLSTKKGYFERHPFVETAQKAINEGKVTNNMIYYIKEYISLLQLITVAHNLKVGNNKEALRMLYNCKTKMNQKRKIMLIGLALVPTPVLRCIQTIKM